MCCMASVGECSRSHLELKSSSLYSDVEDIAYKGSKETRMETQPSKHEMQVKELRLKLLYVPLHGIVFGLCCFCTGLDAVHV